MNSKYELFVFDLDGTLLDTDLAITKTIIELTSIYPSIPNLTIDDILNISGANLKDSLKYLFPNSSLEVVASSYLQISKKYLQDVTLYKGVKELLTSLKARGFKIGIFTNKIGVATNKILINYDLLTLIDGIVAGDDGYPSKPSGEGLVALLEKLNIDPEKTLYVGDNWRDVVAADQSGVDVVFIRSNRRVFDLPLTPTYIIDKIEQLEEVIK